MLIAMLSLAGIPFTVGFFAKFFIFAAAYADGQWLLITIGVLSVACGFYYYLKVVRAMYFQPSAPGAAEKHRTYRLPTGLMRRRCSQRLILVARPLPAACPGPLQVCRAHARRRRPLNGSATRSSRHGFGTPVALSCQKGLRVLSLRQSGEFVRRHAFPPVLPSHSSSSSIAVLAWTLLAARPAAAQEAEDPSEVFPQGFHFGPAG